jgi:hypothetical protein
MMISNYSGQTVGAVHPINGNCIIMIIREGSGFGKKRKEKARQRGGRRVTKRQK